MYLPLLSEVLFMNSPMQLDATILKFFLKRLVNRGQWVVECILVVRRT